MLQQQRTACFHGLTYVGMLRWSQEKTFCLLMREKRMFLVGVSRDLKRVVLYICGESVNTGHSQTRSVTLSYTHAHTHRGPWPEERKCSKFWSCTSVHKIVSVASPFTLYWPPLARVPVLLRFWPWLWPRYIQCNTGLLVGRTTLTPTHILCSQC